MQYSPKGNSASVIKDDSYNCAQLAYIKYFGYDSTTIRGFQRKNIADSIWLGMLKNELNNGRPIQYVCSSFFGGHTWIMDVRQMLPLHKQ